MLGYFFFQYDSQLSVLDYFALYLTHWLLIGDIWNFIKILVDIGAFILTCLVLLRHKYEVICILPMFTFGYLEFAFWPSVLSTVVGIVLLEINHFYNIREHVCIYVRFMSYLCAPDLDFWAWFSICTIPLIKIWKVPLIWILLAIYLRKLFMCTEYPPIVTSKLGNKLGKDETLYLGYQESKSHNLSSLNRVLGKNDNTGNINALNEVILKLWDYVQFYFSKKISKAQKPLQHSWLITVDDIYCGSVPFKIESMKIVDAGLKRKVALDVNISYRGDCSVQMRLAFISGSVRNINATARIRLVLEDLSCEPPFAKGLRIYLVNISDINYDLDGILYVLSTIGLGSILRQQICSGLKSACKIDFSL